MMAGYNTSSAYDLSAFERRADKKTPEPGLKVVKNRRQIASAAFTPRVFSAFAIVITLISLMVYNRAQLNDITTQINSLSVEMETLQAENSKMTSTLDSEVSLTRIAELAEELGMQRRGEHQTKRIYLYREDKIERTEPEAEASLGVDGKMAITSLFSQLKEYIRAK